MPVALQTDRKYKVTIRPRLEIIKHDDLFAPGKETLDVVYRISGLAAQAVKVVVTSAHYKDGPIYERPLGEAERTAGEHTLSWTGKANCKAGELVDRFINPLYAPYKLRIEGGGLAAQAEFKVLYDSIVLARGPWTPDEKEPPESDEKAWVQYMLNELGYYGGPVGHDTESYLKKAVIRYKANHKAFHQHIHKNYDATITADLKNALKAGDAWRRHLDGDAAFSDPAKETVIYVEALTYERTGEKTHEFGVTKKAKKEAERLNRPLLPVEAEIRLRGKSGKAVFSPEAVGPVRVNWRCKDAAEDIAGQFSPTPAEPSRTQDYLRKALAVQGGGAGGDNAPAKFAGIRKPAAENFAAPFLVGAFHPPYDIKKDSGQRVVYGNAAIDQAKYPVRLGKAGVLFRPSIIAGDDYQLTAEIDFTGLPNKSELEGLHAVTDATTRIRAWTGVFRIKRLAKVAVVVDWPARAGSHDWSKVEEEFAKAHIELDTSTLVRKPITDVITQAEYQQVVKKKTVHKNPAKVSLLPDALVGVRLPAQGNKKAKTYKKLLKTYTSTNYWMKIVDDLHTRVVRNLRKDHPSGFIVVDFFTHRPVVLRKHPPADTTVLDPAYITWSFSIGLPDSTVFADQKDVDKVYYVLAHEMGHNFWLLHWENTGETNGHHHDRKDRNCIMSYPTDTGPAHQKSGIYTPHFCGKCNLKLRGWDIESPGLPAKS